MRFFRLFIYSNERYTFSYEDPQSVPPLLFSLLVNNLTYSGPLASFRYSVLLVNVLVPCKLDYFSELLCTSDFSTVLRT